LKVGVKFKTIVEITNHAYAPHTYYTVVRPERMAMYTNFI